MVEKISQLNLTEVYPEVLEGINLNTCGDVDCGNFGVGHDTTVPAFKGPGSQAKRTQAENQNPSLRTGRGIYTLTGDDENPRISNAFEYDGAPVKWSDGRDLKCHHKKGNHTCDVEFGILSNVHFAAELDRLKSQNGLLAGPACKCCGTKYLDLPEEFIFNGANGKTKSRRKNARVKATAYRLIHKPCKGRKGARISVSLDHQSQKNLTENVRILRALVNGSSINDLRRLLADPDTGKTCGTSRLYNRIFWLEKTLLAFESAKLRTWRKDKEASGAYIHNRIAHDDVSISVNWETRQDRRLTQLTCSVSADIDSGYVYRIDANFDPRIDPAGFFEDIYMDAHGGPKNLRKTYTQASGNQFTAPLLHFQRHSGRFDEAAFFASARNSWRVFSAKAHKAFETDMGFVIAIPDDIQSKLDLAKHRMKLIDEIRHGYFGLPDNDRDFRGSFKGIMVKPTYTKAAHLAALKEVLPNGRITLIGEQEAAMVRVVPHVFREEIREDRFEWQVVSFDKNATTPTMQTRVKDFQKQFLGFCEWEKQFLPDTVSSFELLEQFCAMYAHNACAVSKSGRVSPFPISNFQSKQFPQIWLRSPVQSFGETNKTVGFPILRAEYRHKLKRLEFDQPVSEPDVKAALARRTLKATLQPVSAFMNSLRSRISPTKRAGGKSARNGPSYINGAAFNPAVVIALLNIYRVYYNWFEARQYLRPGGEAVETVDVPAGNSTIRVPGSDQVLEVPKRRARKPVLRTPAMRLGADKPSNKAPDPRRVLYRPWLYHGTPLWRKFETR